MKKLFKLSISILVMAFLLTFISPLTSSVNAADKVEAYCKPGKNSFFGFPTWYKYLEVGPKTNQIVGSATNVTDPCAIIGPSDGNGGLDWSRALPRIGLAIVEILLRIAGMVAVGFVIYGGFRYMISQGEPENLKQAQGTIVNALIGLAIAMLATAVVGFIGSKLWG